MGFAGAQADLLLGAVYAPEDVVNLRDRDRDFAVLDELDPLALRHREALSGRLGRRAASLGVLEEERCCTRDAT